MMLKEKLLGGRRQRQHCDSMGGCKGDRNDREGISSDWKAAEAICYSRGVSRGRGNLLLKRPDRLYFLDIRSILYFYVLAFDVATKPWVTL